MSPDKITVDQFYDDLFFFVRENQKIPERFQKKPAAPWTLGNIGAPNCKYIPNDSSSYIQEMQFDQICFIGVRHYYLLKEGSSRKRVGNFLRIS